MIHVPLSIQQQLTDTLILIFESAQAADGDFCGEQREWHLPRLQKAMVNLITMFPTESIQALSDARTPYGE